MVNRAREDRQLLNESTIKIIDRFHLVFINLKKNPKENIKNFLISKKIFDIDMSYSSHLLDYDDLVWLEEFILEVDEYLKTIKKIS